MGESSGVGEQAGDQDGAQSGRRVGIDRTDNPR